MKSSQAPDGAGEQAQSSPFADLPAYPQHEEDASPAAPSHGDMPAPGYGPEMRYEFKQHQFLEKGLCSIFDESGNLRFTVPGRGELCDSSGYELATYTLRYPFRRQADILRNGYTIASVHTVGLGLGGQFRIDTPAGPITVHSEPSIDYRLTGPGGDIVATVWQREGFPVEIASGQDDVLLLASILAMDDIRDRPTVVMPPHP